MAALDTGARRFDGGAGSGGMTEGGVFRYDGGRPGCAAGQNVGVAMLWRRFEEQPWLMA